MKKVLAILTFAIMALAAAFADDPSLQITAKVSAVPPVYSMKAGFVSGTYTTTAASTITAANTLASDKDPSVQDITVYVQILQSNKAKYKKQVTLTVTATDLSATGIADVATVQAATSTNINTTNLTSKGTASGKVATFTINYTNGKPVQAAEVGTASFKWEKNEDLPVGNYSATITMSYEAN